MPAVALELIAPFLAFLALFYSLVFWNQVTSAPDGTAAMQKVASAISVGARAFVQRQYRTIAVLALVVGFGMMVI